MSREPAQLIGRASECAGIMAALDGFDESGNSGVTALLLSGDPGIGKTALWDWATRERSSMGDHVLISRASAAEARLAWAGMTDLLRGVGPPILSRLPEPQQRALRAITLQGGEFEGVDERAVGTAWLSVLQLLSESAPVLLGIDDLPYLDAASAAGIAFALRRLGGRYPTRLVATARDHRVALPVVQGLPVDRVQAWEVGPLSLAALFELLRDRTGISLARPLLLRVHSTSGGNPLYALELARALDRLEIRPQSGEPLPVPVGLSALVQARLRDLPPDVRELVAATAATWRLTGSAEDRDAIDLAVDAELVVLDEPTVRGGARVIRAAHPLLSAAAYNGLSAERRRALHERLSTAAESPIERARHLALATDDPSNEVARALDAAVSAALAEGVPDIAVELAQLAIEHTTDRARTADRLDRLADARLRAGDSAGAWHAQADSVALTDPGPRRGRRRIRLAEISTEVKGWAAAERELADVVAESSDEPEVLSEALLSLAAVTNDINLADSSATRAVALLDALARPDPVILSGALAQAAGARFRAGRGLDHAMFERAIEIERRHPYRRLSDRADANYAALLKYADDLDGAEIRLTSLLAEARATGDLSSIAYSLAHLVHVALWRGRLAQARVLAEEHVEVAAHGGLAAQGVQARCNLGAVLAYQGSLEAASTILTSVEQDPATGDWDRHRAHGVLGFVALSRGDALTAVEQLDRWWQALTAMHFGEPGYSRSHLDYVCALVSAGRVHDAQAFQVELDAQAVRSGRESAAAVASLGLALVLAATGKVDQAQEPAQAALDWYEGSALRFDRARALLIAGQIQRRAKAKLAAQAMLAEARQEFATFGSRTWQAQAEAELARVNVRPSAPAELTETELRVAELAAAGLTNREVAARTFLAVKTVEANLARAYRKLGIRSRAELGARMAARGMEND